jgi:hypothetical protein
MRVVYRAIGAVAAVVVLAGVAVVMLLGRGDSAQRGAAVVSSPLMARGPASPAPASGIASAPVGAVVSAVPTSGASAARASATSPAASPVGPDGTPSSSSTGKTVMDAALSDERLPALPKSSRELRKFAGRAAPVHGLVKDKRSGVALPRFAKYWKVTKATPFASRQVLPKVKGSAFRGLLVSCAVPIPMQDNLRDTAFLAARWTLNHHPSGATVTWTASQPIKVGKRYGWLLGYNVHYTLKGKKRISAAAAALVEVPGKKPALVFVTIPDSQKTRWHDINTVMSHLKGI